jgi:hypothetical protein
MRIGSWAGAAFREVEIGRSETRDQCALLIDDADEDVARLRSAPGLRARRRGGQRERRRGDRCHGE